MHSLFAFSPEASDLTAISDHDDATQGSAEDVINCELVRLQPDLASLPEASGLTAISGSDGAQHTQSSSMLQDESDLTCISNHDDDDDDAHLSAQDSICNKTACTYTSGDEIECARSCAYCCQ